LIWFAVPEKPLVQFLTPLATYCSTALICYLAERQRDFIIRRTEVFVQSICSRLGVHNTIIENMTTEQILKYGHGHRKLEESMPRLVGMVKEGIAEESQDHGGEGGKVSDLILDENEEDQVEEQELFNTMMKKETIGSGRGDFKEIARNDDHEIPVKYKSANLTSSVVAATGAPRRYSRKSFAASEHRKPSIFVTVEDVSTSDDLGEGTVGNSTNNNNIDNPPTFQERLQKWNIIKTFSLSFRNQQYEQSFLHWNHRAFVASLKANHIIGLILAVMHPFLDIDAYCNTWPTSPSLCYDTPYGDGIFKFRIIYFVSISLISLVATFQQQLGPIMMQRMTLVHLILFNFANMFLTIMVAGRGFLDDTRVCMLYAGLSNEVYSITNSVILYSILRPFS
jgi:hypothetical protein